MLWLSFIIFIRLVFLASVAIVSSFEVVVLALGALPSTFWEVEEESVLFGAVVWHELWSSSYSWHENCTLWVEARSVDGFSFDWSRILVLEHWSLAENGLKLSWAFVSWWTVEASGLAAVIIWVWRTVVVVSSKVEVLMWHRWLNWFCRLNGRVAIDDIQQIGTNGSILSAWVKLGVSTHVAVFLNEILIEFWVQFLIFFGRLIFIV